MNRYLKKITKEQALQKIRHYCRYQERCHKEVKEKLYSLGMYRNEAEELTASLIEDGYLNEERFAIQFAQGKFRIKKWGKTRITYELKQKQVSNYCIKKALENIDEKEYLLTAQKHFSEKSKTLSGEKNIFIKNRKLQDYLLSKGFEANIVYDLIKKKEQ